MSWLRRRHRIISRVQGPDRYARALCLCGSRFIAPDGRYMLHDFNRWRREHPKKQHADG